ncbi:hypothetical protein ACLEPN_22825 [Myxococcus sp. 1LA]
MAFLPSDNLPDMSREKNKSMTDNQRAAVARGWASSRMDQASYARLHGIKPRTLRQWVLRWAPTVPADVRALTIIEQVIRDLQALRDAVSANMACHPAEQHQEPDHREPLHPPSADPARRLAALSNAETIMATPPPKKGAFEW